MDFLAGKKTYFVAILMGLAVVANQLGYLSSEGLELVLKLGGVASVATIRSAIKQDK